MLRIAIILAIICILFRWAFGKWPWQGLGGKPSRSQRIFRARKLLQVEEHASRDQIIAAHKRRLAEVHPDRGGSNEKVHEANDARDLLLSEIAQKPLEDTRGD